MTNVAGAALITGALMPFLITILNQAGLPKIWNELITILACGAAGAVTVWATGGFANFKVGNLIGVIALVFVASQAAYASYWKNTSTEVALNEKTSLIK